MRLNENWLLPIEIEQRTQAPQSPEAGDVYFDSGDYRLKFWNGSAWVNAGPSAISSPRVTFVLAGASLQAAIDAAGASVADPAIVHIAAGTYTEDITLTPGVHVQGEKSGGGVTLLGKVRVVGTGTDPMASLCSIKNLVIVNDGEPETPAAITWGTQPLGDPPDRATSFWYSSSAAQITNPPGEVGGQYGTVYGFRNVTDSDQTSFTYAGNHAVFSLTSGASFSYVYNSSYGQSDFGFTDPAFPGNLPFDCFPWRFEYRIISGPSGLVAYRQTVAKTGTIPVSNGDTVTLVAESGTVKLKVNGSVVHTFSDPPASSTYKFVCSLAKASAKIDQISFTFGTVTKTAYSGRPSLAVTGKAYNQSNGYGVRNDDHTEPYTGRAYGMPFPTNASYSLVGTLASGWHCAMGFCTKPNPATLADVEFAVFLEGNGNTGPNPTNIVKAYRSGVITEVLTFHNPIVNGDALYYWQAPQRLGLKNDADGSVKIIADTFNRDQELYTFSGKSTSYGTLYPVFFLTKGGWFDLTETRQTIDGTGADVTYPAFAAAGGETSAPIVVSGTGYTGLVVMGVDLEVAGGPGPVLTSSNPKSHIHTFAVVSDHKGTGAHADVAGRLTVMGQTTFLGGGKAIGLQANAKAGVKDLQATVSGTDAVSLAAGASGTFQTSTITNASGNGFALATGSQVTVNNCTVEPGSEGYVATGTGSIRHGNLTTGSTHVFHAGITAVETGDV